MHYDVVLDLEEATDAEWKAERHKGLTGSDTAAILGVDTRRSAYQVFVDKTGDAPVDIEANEAMLWGTLLEAPVRRELAHRIDLPIRNPHVLVASPEHPWLRATPDGFVEGPDDSGLAEIKTTGFFLRDEWADGPPDRAAAQCAHYLAATGAPWAYIAVLIAGQTFKHFYVERDDELIDRIVDIESTFWHDNVLARKAPPIDAGHTGTQDLIRALWPEEREGSIRELPASMHDVALELQRVRAQEAEARKRGKELATQLLAWAEDADTITWGGSPLLTMRSQTRKAYEVAESTSRPIRFVKSKGEK